MWATSPAAARVVHFSTAYYTTGLPYCDIFHTYSRWGPSHGRAQQYTREHNGEEGNPVQEPGASGQLFRGRPVGVHVREVVQQPQDGSDDPMSPVHHGDGVLMAVCHVTHLRVQRHHQEGAALEKTSSSTAATVVTGRLQSCSIRAVSLGDGRTPRAGPRFCEGDVLSRERPVGADSTMWKDFAIVLPWS